MKILHTADWHLGKTLYKKSRYTEMQSFFDWLLQTVEKRGIDIVLMAGDVFDSPSASHKAQEMYYSFLAQLSKCCQHIVITAGNHDSPAFLSAPQTFLKFLNVHIIGKLSPDIAENVLVLRQKSASNSLNKQGDVLAVICAIPYLRDRDLRVVEHLESDEEKDQKIVQAISNAYTLSAEKGDELRKQYESEQNEKIPLIAMGHLFASGGKTVEGDGVRELYVGSLAQINSDTFSPLFDYVALGHLHVPQILGGHETLRYSGSPIAMGFNESKQQKQVVELSRLQKSDADLHLGIEILAIPSWQRLERLKEDSLESLLLKLEKLCEENESIWLEVEYLGSDSGETVIQAIEKKCENSQVEVLRIKTLSWLASQLKETDPSEQLSDLGPNDVFERILSDSPYSDHEKNELMLLHQQVLKDVLEENTVREK